MDLQNTHYTAAELITIALAAVLVVLPFVYFGYRAWQRSRVTAEERERRRCTLLVSKGKISDATLVEIREKVIFYSYDVRGVEYTASQDIGWLVRETIADFSGVNAMSVRYDPRNPANSIVMAREWSGLRGAARYVPQNHSSD